MFTNKDYIEYFKQLYAVEVEMEREARELKLLVNNAEAKKLLEVIQADEKRHKKIVRDLQKLVTSHAHE